MPATQNGFPSIKFGRLLVCNDGGTWGDDPDEETEATLVLRSTDQTESGQWSLKEPALRRLAPSERHRAQLLAGDLVMTKSSGSAKHIGKTTIVSPEIADTGAAFSNFMQRFRLRSSNAPQYYWYVTQSRVFRNQILLASTTTTGLSNLAGRVVATFSVPQPSLKKQQQIADYLDHETAEIDAFIADITSFRDLTEERYASELAVRLLTGTQEHSGVSTEHGIEWLKNVPLPIGWEKVKLSYLAHLQSGDALTGEHIKEQGVYPVYGGGGFRGFTSTANQHTNRVLIGRQGALAGKVFTADAPFFATEHAIVTYPKRDLDLMWFECMLRLMNLGQYSVAAAQPGIGVDAISKKKVPVPSEAEQREIGEALRDANESQARLSNDLDRAIDLARERRAALITAAVTGQIDVAAKHKPAAEQLEDDIAQGRHRESA